MQKKINKKILRQSLFDLMSKKNIENITVNDIICNSGLSRSTFYRTYTDKYELMDDCYKEAVDELNTIFTSNDRPKVIEGIYIFLRSRSSFFQNAARVDGADSIMHYMYKHTFDYYKRQLLDKKGTGSLSQEELDCIEFYCAGAVRLFELWIDRNMKEDPKTMSKRIYNNMPTDLKNYF